MNAQQSSWFPVERWDSFNMKLISIVYISHAFSVCPLCPYTNCLLISFGVKRRSRSHLRKQPINLTKPSRRVNRFEDQTNFLKNQLRRNNIYLEFVGFVRCKCISKRYYTVNALCVMFVWNNLKIYICQVYLQMMPW